MGVGWVKDALGLSDVTVTGTDGDRGALASHPLAILVESEFQEYEDAAHPPYAATGADPAGLGFRKVCVSCLLVCCLLLQHT